MEMEGKVSASRTVCLDFCKGPLTVARVRLAARRVSRVERTRRVAGRVGRQGKELCRGKWSARPKLTSGLECQLSSRNSAQKAVYKK